MEVSLHPQPGGDVAGLVEGPDDRARLVAQRRIGDLPGGLHTVEVAELLDHREGLARQRPVHQRSENDGLLGREQREQILTDPLLVAHDAQEVVAMRPVEPDHPVVTVEGEDGRYVGLHNVAKQAEGPRPLVDRLLQALVDLPHHRRRPRRQSRRHGS